MNDAKPNSLINAQWAGLLGPAGAEDAIWSPEDLATILRHQLAVRIEVDLAAVDLASYRAAVHDRDVRDHLSHSFGELLAHESPPLKLLIMVKDFAKSIASLDGGPIPAEVAKVIYFAAIAVGISKHHRLITSMPEIDLIRSIQWACRLPWIDNDTRELMLRAAEQLKQSRG